MKPLKNIFLLAICAIALSLQAGPKGYFRAENGALIHGEVLYADDNFYYYRKISDPNEILTVRIENVPASFQRLVNSLRLKGEIVSPPESIAKNEIIAKPANPYGKWRVKETREGGTGLYWYHAVLETNDDQGQIVRLIVRYAHNEKKKNTETNMPYRDGFFEVYLLFDDNITIRPSFQVAYQFDNKEQIIERWGRAGNSPKALFARDPYVMVDCLLKSDYMNFIVNDMKNEERRFGFYVGDFKQVHKNFFEPAINKSTKYSK